VNYLVIKLGISIFSVPNQDVNVLLDFIIDNGFEALELWDEDSSHNTVNSEKQEYIKNSGLSVSIHAPLLNLGSTSEFEKNIRALKKTIQKAYNYNAKRIVLHTGVRPPRTGSSSALDTAQNTIEKVINRVEEQGILLCIENVGYLGNDLISDFAELINFVARFPNDNVGIAFDVSHAALTSDAQLGIKLLRERIRLIHLSDTDNINQIHHLPLGEGNIDFSSILENTFNYAGILEITPNENWKRNILDCREFLQERKLVK